MGLCIWFMFLYIIWSWPLRNLQCSGTYLNIRKYCFVLKSFFQVWTVHVSPGTLQLEQVAKTVGGGPLSFGPEPLLSTEWPNVLHLYPLRIRQSCLFLNLDFQPFFLILEAPRDPLKSFPFPYISQSVTLACLLHVLILLIFLLHFSPLHLLKNF